MTEGIGGNSTNSSKYFRTSKTECEAVDSSRELDDDYVIKKGKCYIFNHETFESHISSDVRNGTDADADSLCEQFESLGFEVQVFKDLKLRKVIDTLEEAGKGDYSNVSCFVCCILSHGDRGLLYAKDGKYPAEKVFAPFRDDNCPSLVGKPKLFFIQACRGEDVDSGIRCTERLDSSIDFNIPTDPEFLVVNSSPLGFLSWRNPRIGSWFIQAVCAAIEEHAKNKDLLSILTIVNRKVAFEFESCTRDQTKDKKKQVPVVTSTLTRNIRFS